VSPVIPKPYYSVELIADGGKHFYRVQGTPPPTRMVVDRVLPGVTGVLQVISKPALIPWAKREALEHVRQALISKLGGKEKRVVRLTADWIDLLIKEAKGRPDYIKDEAADLGTQAHAFIDKIIRKEPFDLAKVTDERVANAVMAFVDWWHKCEIQFVMGDTKVASLLHGYGGSLDALGVTADGRIVLLDWKTSNAIYDEYALQVAAYAKAYEEMYGATVSEAWIVRFGKKDAKFEVKKLKDIEHSFLAFLAAHHLQQRLLKDHFVTQEN
jgi:hypothetical protein